MLDSVAPETKENGRPHQLLLVNYATINHARLAAHQSLSGQHPSAVKW